MILRQVGVFFFLLIAVAHTGVWAMEGEHADIQHYSTLQSLGNTQNREAVTSVTIRSLKPFYSPAEGPSW